MRILKAVIPALAMVVIPAMAHAQATISAQQARSIALSAVPNNQGVKSEKLHKEDGVLVYEFDIRTAGPGHREVRVDARTGAIVQSKHEEGAISKVARKTEHEADKAARKAQKEADKVFGKDEIASMNVRISESHARRIALRETGGGTVKDVDLKREHDVVLWDVKVDGPGHGHSDVRIDANTGAILKLDRHK